MSSGNEITKFNMAAENIKTGVSKKDKSRQVGHSPGRKRSVACDDVGLITRSVIMSTHPGVREAGLKSSPRA